MVEGGVRILMYCTSYTLTIYSWFNHHINCFTIHILARELPSEHKPQRYIVLQFNGLRDHGDEPIPPTADLQLLQVMHQRILWKIIKCCNNTPAASCITVHVISPGEDTTYYHRPSWCLVSLPIGKLTASVVL